MMPLSLKLFIRLVLFSILVQTVARIGFTVYFSPPSLDSTLLTQAFLLGARFDLRLAALAWLPLAILTVLPKFGGKIALWTKVWGFYSGVLGLVLFFFLVLDWGHYSYLQNRLNANLIFLLANPAESLGTVWHTYPVIWLSLALILATALWTWGCRNIIQYTLAHYQAPVWSRPRTKWIVKTLWGVFGFFIWLLPIHGKLGQYPLRWSDLYFTPQAFYISVSTNPVLNFYDTYRYAKNSFHLDELKRALPVMDPFLGITNRRDSSLLAPFSRLISPSPGQTAINRSNINQPNVVLIYLESFSGYKTTTFGNPLNPTPFYNSIAQKGTLFTHFYTAHAGTARGVFTGLTGTPDVEISDTASRNPLYANQHILINQLTDYAKFYFIGGSLSWANIRGVVQNIKGIKTYEEGDYAASRNDVWGVSDKNMFLEANQIFTQQKKPFFAMIQTSGNHRPYTIPLEDKDFKWDSTGHDQLVKHGFSSQAEYNSFRYMDYCLDKFFTAAKKEKYFNNTIFVLLGDHGISGTTGAHMPAAYTALNLSQTHTPFLLYAPQLIPAQKIDRIAQQIDVMPTILGQLNLPYQNTSLGRDAVGSARIKDGAPQMAFMIEHFNGPTLTVFDQEFLLKYNLSNGQSALYRYLKDATTDIAKEQPQVLEKMRAFAIAYYTSAQFLLGHNPALH